MSFTNYVAQEINCKIVYYGAALSGKTTNLQWIFERSPQANGSKMISLATETDRTLFFDFLPVDVGTIRGFKIRLHLYTVPGQASYQPNRKMILRGVDGVVLVADSRRERERENVDALRELQESLAQHGYDFPKIPYALQLNKRDLTAALPIEQLKKALVRKGEPVLEAVACQGVGVFETLKAVARQVLAQLKNA